MSVTFDRINPLSNVKRSPPAQDHAARTGLTLAPCRGSSDAVTLRERQSTSISCRRYVHGPLVTNGSECRHTPPSTSPPARESRRDARDRRPRHSDTGCSINRCPCLRYATHVLVMRTFPENALYSTNHHYTATPHRDPGAQSRRLDLHEPPGQPGADNATNQSHHSHNGNGQGGRDGKHQLPRLCSRPPVSPPPELTRVPHVCPPLLR